MVQSRRSIVGIALCIAAITAIAAAAIAVRATAGDAGAKKPWKVTGQLEEACSCNAACPCWFGSKPSRMTCGGGQVLFIEKGKYGDVALDGLAVANFSQSPPGESMMDSFGKWTFSYLYVDDKARPDQREALEQIGKTVLPVAASKNVKVRYVPIARAIDGKEHKITVGTFATFHGHLLEGGLGGTPKIVDPPGADPVHHEYSQGQTTTLTYKDAEQDWSFEKSNYMFGTFTVDSEQYEKYAAGLAQKMAAMEKQKAQSPTPK